MLLHDWKTSGGKNEDRVEGRSLEKANSSETYLPAIKVTDSSSNCPPPVQRREVCYAATATECAGLYRA